MYTVTVNTKLSQGYIYRVLRDSSLLLGKLLHFGVHTQLVHSFLDYYKSFC